MPRRRGDYRDDYDRDYDRDDRRSRRYDPPEGDGSGTALKILLAIGGVFVCLSLVCGGVVWYAVYSTKQAAVHAADRVADLAEKAKVEAAENQKRWAEEAERARQRQAELAELDHKQRLEDIARDRKRKADEDERARKERQAKLANKAKAKRVADAFLAEVRTGQIDAAYPMTSDNFRKRVSKEKLADLAREYKASLARMSLREFGAQFDNNLDAPYRYEVTTTTSGGFIRMEMSIDQQGDEWKVESFTVGPHDPFGK